MRSSFIVFTLVALTCSGLADKTCTPSFDYCAEALIESKGFTEDDVKKALQGTGYENEDLNNVLLHCTNPGQVGHAKLCSSGCHEPASEGSHEC
ncbi:hypothetical protein PISL3812_04898 [Talaromyces islandicus]|uniref:Uncharacterized protein n=1 Tax=Talaromyces islandicus TaxID=28573 RepID=A0A0U1LWS9_TALIS|nr:hypothetical protein PISL3812_04898 [Talaromyces islandicus]